MSIPETTSAEAFWRYAGGKCLFESRGEAWRDIKAWLTALPPVVGTLHLPAVSEPFLAWTTSGEVDFEEREGGGPWVTNRIKKGSFFLTTGGAPYEASHRANMAGSVALCFSRRFSGRKIPPFQHGNYTRSVRDGTHAFRRFAGLFPRPRH